ncbi:MAG: apolipoprotein N-acyltransferase [Chlamydiae bacterium]|nr:apolipoprotein N-acyltransferase [Chlamydiota bacterium]
MAFGQPAWLPLFGPIAAIIGYSFFWVFLDFRGKGHNRFLISTAWFFAVQLVQLSWLTSIKYQGFYILVVYLLISLFMAVQFALLTKFLFSRNLARIGTALAVASLGTLVEWSRLYILCGFSFNFSGMALACYVPSMQFASVFGIFGLSFLVWFTNALAFRAFKGHMQLSGVALWCGVAIFPYFFGFLSSSLDQSIKDTSSPIRVLLVQPALTPSEKIPLHRFAPDFISPYVQWKQIFTFAIPYQEMGIDLLVLPESVVVFGVDSYIYSFAHVEQIMKHLGVDGSKYFPSFEPPFAESRDDSWVVSNSFWVQTLANFTSAEIIAGFDQTDKILQQHYNAAFHFAPFSKTFCRYEKQILLPLAEMLPWKFLKYFTSSYGITEFFTAGKEAKLLGSKWKAGVSICIEETFPEVMRAARNKGAELFVNVTNDGWYPGSNLPIQHFSHSRIRAVENGIPLVRACNTGLTAMVDSRGNLICSMKPESWSSPATKGVIYKKIYLHKIRTLYSLWGDAALIALCLVFLAWALGLRDEGSIF